MAIFVLTATTTTTTQPITLPLVHARRVKKIRIKIHGGLGAHGEIIFTWARRMG